MFFVNVPIAVAAFIAAAAFVDESRGEATVGGFDVPGFLAASVGFSSLVLGIIEGPRFGWLTATRALEVGDWAWPWRSLSFVPIALVVGVGAIAIFVLIENRRLRAGRFVLFDLRLFRIRSFRYGNVLAALVGLGEFGLVFVVPLYLQTVVQYSALQTGVLFLAMAAGGFLGGPLAAYLAPPVRPAPGCFGRDGARGARRIRSRARPDADECSFRPGDCSLRVRGRRWTRQLTACLGDPRRGAGSCLRPGLRHAEHLPSGRGGAGHRDAGNDLHHQHGDADRGIGSTPSPG